MLLETMGSTLQMEDSLIGDLNSFGFVAWNDLCALMQESSTVVYDLLSNGGKGRHDGAYNSAHRYQESKLADDAY